MQLSRLKLDRKFTTTIFCCIQEGMLIYDTSCFIYLVIQFISILLLIDIIFIWRCQRGYTWSMRVLQNSYPKSQIEWQRRQRLVNLELDDTLDHCIWNGLDTMQYKFILGDCVDIANHVPKKDYSLVIADIPHGYNIRNTMWSQYL